MTMAKTAPTYNVDESLLKEALEGFNNPAKIQEKIAAFIKLLKDQNVPEERIEQISVEIMKTVMARTVTEIAKVMTENDIKRWNEFVDTKPNDLQQMGILDLFYKTRTKETIEDLQDRLIEQTLKSTVDQLLGEADLRKKISKMDDAKAKETLKLFEKGQYAQAMENINKMTSK